MFIIDAAYFEYFTKKYITNNNNYSMHEKLNYSITERFWELMVW